MIEWEIAGGSLEPDCPERVYVSLKGAEDGSHLDQEEYNDLRSRLGIGPGISLRNRVSLAVQTALEWGQVDGEHHLRWVIDQMLSDLLPEDEYEALTTEHGAWDVGVAP